MLCRLLRIDVGKIITDEMQYQRFVDLQRLTLGYVHIARRTL